MALSLDVVAYQYGDATKIAWIQYLAIIFCYIAQIILFDDVPDIFVIIGIILVIIAASLSVLEEAYKNYYENNEEQHKYQEIPQIK